MMQNIKPVSDLQNYNEVLRDVSVGNPVFLAENGSTRYAILDIMEYEKTQAIFNLIAALAKGEQSAKVRGWLTLDELQANLGMPLGKSDYHP